jgi:hypothetical protein
MGKGETKLGCYYAYYSMPRSTCSDAHSSVIWNRVKNPSQKKSILQTVGNDGRTSTQRITVIK